MNNKIMNTFNGLVFFMMLLTGFAQMPIFKRYYISDFSGLGWLANFEVTHVMHYGFAIVFTVLVFYKGTMFFLDRVKDGKVVTSWIVPAVRSLMILGIIFSGYVLVSRNLPGYRFSKETITGFDIVHLGLVMMFLMFSLAMGVMKRLKLLRAERTNA